MSFPLPPAKVLLLSSPKNLSAPLEPIRFSTLISVSLLAALPDVPPDVVPSVRLILSPRPKAEKSIVSEPEPPS